MPAPKKTRKKPLFGRFKPFKMTLEFRPNPEDGDSVLIAYSSYDPRIDSVGPDVCAAIAEACGLDVTRLA